MEHFKGISRKEDEAAINEGKASPMPEFAASQEKGTEMIEMLKEQIKTMSYAQVDDFLKNIQNADENVIRQTAESEELYRAMRRDPMNRIGRFLDNFVFIGNPNKFDESHIGEKEVLRNKKKGRLLEELEQAALARKEEILEVKKAA